MDGEFNGSAEWSSNNVNNEQNRAWAAQLADAALAAPNDTCKQKDQKLPTDVLVVVAEALAGERDLHGLSNLNVVSQAVNAGTLPVLYETLIISDEQAFQRSIGSTFPKGWKYVKFLFVTTVTLRLLRLHLRMYARDMPNSTYEFATSFPRLILLGLTDVTSPSPLDHEHPLEITLYKPIRFPALLSACINYGDGRKGYGRNCGISFFGTHYLGQNAAGRRTGIEPTTFCDIVRLDVRPGACILRTKGWPITAMKGWHATFCGVNFELVIAGDVEETGLEETLRTVLGHLALYATSEQVTQHQKRIRFKVTCLPRILDRITELYDHVQPCFLDFKFCLTSPVNKEDMQRYFRALASVYRQYWATHAHTHDSTKEIRFTDIDAPATALHPAWIQEYDLDTNPEADQYWSAWGGNMWCGPGDVLEWNGDSDAEDERDDVGEEAREEGIEDDAEDDAEEDEEAFAVVPVGPVPPAAIANRDPLEGFEVNLYRTLMYKDELENSHMIWARGYPIAMPARAIDEL